MATLYNRYRTLAAAFWITWSLLIEDTGDQSSNDYSNLV